MKTDFPTLLLQPEDPIRMLGNIVSGGPILRRFAIRGASGAILERDEEKGGFPFLLNLGIFIQRIPEIRKESGLDQGEGQEGPQVLSIAATAVFQSNPLRYFGARER